MLNEAEISCSREDETTQTYLPKNLSKTHCLAKRAASKALITSRESFQNTLRDISEDKLQGMTLAYWQNPCFRNYPTVEWYLSLYSGIQF